MAQTRRTLAVLAAVAFCINCQPSEPFLSDYLQTDKGLREQDLDDVVWPADTYASFAFLLPVGFLAESWGYARTVALGLVCREATRIVLIFAGGLGWMVFMQVTYAIATDINTVFFALVYLVVPHDQFDLATSLLFAAYHGGNVVGAALGQLLRDYAHAPYRDLFYVSWAFTSVGLLIFFLGRKAFSSGHSSAAAPAPAARAPPHMAARQSSALEEARVALLQADENEGGADYGSARSQREPPSAAGEPISLAAELRAKGVREVLRQLRDLYTTRVVLLWSLWWLFGEATHTFFGNYYQTLFGHFFEKVSYGWLEVALEVGAVVGSLAPWVCKPHARRTWQLIALPSIMVTVMLVMSVILYSPQAWLYVWTVGISCVAAALKAWASSAIAEHLEGRRYALIFTVNTFLALGLATVASAVFSGIGASTLAYYWLSAALAACPVLIVTGSALVSRRLQQGSPVKDIGSAVS